jgi:organic radical activating enzyme
MRELLTYLDKSDDDECVINWFMTRACNFRCEYCFNGNGSSKEDYFDRNKYSPQHIAQSFDRIGRKLRIFMTGGEPFLFPNFIEICGLLTRNYRIGMNTNLSTANVREFASSIDPAKVLAIQASLHIIEREKIPDGLALFIERVKILQEKDFPVRVEYITYPPVIPRMKKDLDFLTDQGIRATNVKIFRGKFQGKSYPDSYSAEERKIITALSINTRESVILSLNTAFFGSRCSAGQRFLVLGEDGSLFRCTSSKKSRGNLFAGDATFSKTPKLCSYETCVCPYEGIMFALPNRGNKILAFVARPILRLFTKWRKRAKQLFLQVVKTGFS